MKIEKKVRFDTSSNIGVWQVGVNTKNPLYIVAIASRDGSRGKNLHVLSGRHARENAFKRFRWICYGIPYRENQTYNGIDAKIREVQNYYVFH